jgi:hypothetical protein
MNFQNIIKEKGNHRFELYDLFYFMIFISIGIIGRYILVGWSIQPFPNFEIIMILTFIAALFIKPYLAFLVPLISMIGSDLLLGNAIFSGSQLSKIILFTYTGFLLISLFSIFTKKKTSSRLRSLGLKSITLSLGVGIGFTLLYDTWTNIGWWFLMYPHTLESLLAVFVAGIPFMIYHLLSATVTFTLIGLPLIVFSRKKQILEKTDYIPIIQKISLLSLTISLIVISIMV